MLAELVQARMWTEPRYAAEASNDPTLGDELARAKNRVLAHALALPADSASRTAMLAKIATDGGDPGQVDSQVQAIRGVDLAAVQRLAASTLQPARMISALRGNRDAVAAAFAALGVTRSTIEWIGSPDPGHHEVRPTEMPKVAGIKN